MNPNDTSLHPDDLLFLYVEDLLAPDDRERVEAHVRECKQCSDEVRQLRTVILGLKEHRRSFCPEAWEVYEQAERRGGADQTLMLHIASCSQCQEELNRYTAPSGREEMPESLWMRVKEELHPQESEPAVIDRSSPPASFWERLFKPFRIPALGLAAAAAAILVVVFLYPQEMLETRVGMSSVAWDQAPRPKVAQPEKRVRTAILIFFKDFKESVPQKEIDALYRALEPPIEVSAERDVLTPSTVKQAIKGKAINPYERGELLRGLNTNLGVSSAVLVTITSAGSAFNVQCELVNTSDGRITAQKTESGASEADLPSRVRDATLGIITQSP